MAQLSKEEKAARKAANAAKKEQRAAKQQKKAAKQQQLPATGGIAAGSVAVLGTGALLVGGRLVVRRGVRR